MPGRTLPTILSSDVASRTTADSCYVTRGTKVYDVTPFLEDHPGGGDLILEYAGKDVSDIMSDESSHTHPQSAYDMLDEDYLIGFVATEPILKTVMKSEQPDNIVPLPPTEAGMQELQENGYEEDFSPRVVHAATGMSCEADLSVETDRNEDYQKHKFLDLSKPLLKQVWYGGFSRKVYLEQVHRPRFYKKGESAPLFGNFLEFLTKTPWYAVPMIWMPWVAYGTFLAYRQLPLHQTAAYWLTGLFLWTLVEYTLHRGLFHVDKYLPDNRVGITTHFLLHGIHHYMPMDQLRLVMPPALFFVLAIPFYRLAHFVFYWDWYVAIAVFCGGIFGYVCYDVTHYSLHHKKLPTYYQTLRQYHMAHHYDDYENGFGVTSRFWDRVFGTELGPPRAAKAA